MIGVAGWFLQFGEIKNGAVKFADFVRLNDAQGEMADATRSLLVLVNIQVRAVFHSLLGEIEDIARWIVRANPGEGPVARPLEHLDLGIFLFEPRENQLDILYFKSEVIKTGLAPRRSGIQVQAYVAIADDDRASGPRHSRALHPENVPVKIAFMIDVAADNGHVLYLGKHSGLLSSKMRLP
jgi:hypothetical protein